MMVYELKPPVGESPGFLVFTHKERPFFLDSGDAVTRRLLTLKERYVFGMQWGSYHEDVGQTPFIDVHLACPGTVDFSPNADVRRISLCSRNFTPDRFRPMDIPTTWDILAVGHPIKIKRMSTLLEVIRDLYDHNHEVSALLICAIPEPPHRLDEFWDHAFFEKYESLFSPEERERIDLGVPVEARVDNRPLHPIPNEVFPYLYNASNCFTLFSEREGQSKVVHEALLCGTPVVVRDDLRGGGRDYLDERNSRQFGDPSEAREAFADIASSPEEYAFDPSYLRSELAESETVDRLEAEIEAVYRELGRPYAGHIEKTDLAFKLGGHTLTLPPDLRRETTNDLRSPRALGRYADRKLDRPVPFTERVELRRADLEYRAETVRERGLGGVFSPPLRWLERRTSLPVHTTAKRLANRYL